MNAAPNSSVAGATRQSSIYCDTIATGQFRFGLMIDNGTPGKPSPMKSVPSASPEQQIGLPVSVGNALNNRLSVCRDNQCTRQISVARVFQETLGSFLKR